jgi:hypothetical protein
MLLHLTIAIVLPTFTLLFLWQVRRALGGNELSWAYVFEWPFFGGYAIYLWWRLVHEPPDEPAVSDPGNSDRATTNSASSATTSAANADEDAEMAAYNRYLAELHSSGRRKHW